MFIKPITLLSLFLPSVILTNNALAKNTAGLSQVTANQETKVFFDDKRDNDSDADDPAIWVNPIDNNKSLIIGTLKKGGLAVFNMDGKMIQQVTPSQNKTNGLKGRYNNVDILRGYLLENKTVDLAIVSDRGFDTLKVFLISYQGQNKPILQDITANDIPRLFSQSIDDIKTKRTAYGLAVHYNTKQQQAIGFVTQANRSNIAQVEFFTTTVGTISYRVNHYHTLPSTFSTEADANWTPCEENDGDLPELEGLVIDGQRQVLYAGQEHVGIWQINYQEHRQFHAGAQKGKITYRLVDTIASYGVPYKRIWDAEEKEYQCQWLNSLPKNPHLMADVEGLALYQPERGDQYLIASSQGDDHYAVYKLLPQSISQTEFIGRFQITKGLVDGASHTDGVAITSQAIGNEYPHGLMVVQDGEDEPLSYNTKGKRRDGTNFKFISWDKIKNQLHL